MEILFSFLAVAGLAQFLKFNVRIESFLGMLFLLATVYLYGSKISPEGSYLVLFSSLGIVLTVNFVFSSWRTKPWTRYVVPILSIGGLFLIGKSEASLDGYTLDLSLPKVIGTVVMGFLGGIILDVKQYFIHKWFKEISHKRAERMVLVTVMGLFALLATFFVSWFGLLFLAAGFYMHTVYQERTNMATVLALTGLSLIGYFVSIHQIESVDLTIGKNVVGLILGVAFAYLVRSSLYFTNRMLGIGFSALSALLVVFIAAANQIHPAYGGAEAFVAALAGTSMALFVIGERGIGSYVVPIMVFIGIVVPSNPFSKPVQNESTQQSDNDVSISAFQMPAFDSSVSQDFSGKVGVYKIDKASALIEFHLGPKGGVTEGEISQFEGTVIIGETVEETRFSVKLPVKNLTTFNAIRDESLMEDIYFDEPNFPLMTFESTSMKKLADQYELTGKFTLLGTTKSETIQVKYLGVKDGNPVFIGSSSIDKTKYGMASSPQEGDIIDFVFYIKLIANS